MHAAPSADVLHESCQHSSTCLTASAVITTLSKAIRLPGRYQLHRVRQPCAGCAQPEQVFVQLTGDDQHIFQSHVFSFCASSLVFGASTENFSTTIDDPDVPVRTGCFSAHRGTSFVNFLTVVLRTSSKGHATRTQIGLLIEPERARPVPFWRHGFYRNQLLQHESSEHEYPDEPSCISNNNLVNQRFVEITTEVVSETVSALCASFNTNSIAIPYAFTAGLTIRSLPVAPGTDL